MGDTGRGGLRRRALPDADDGEHGEHRRRQEPGTEQERYLNIRALVRLAAGRDASSDDVAAAWASDPDRITSLSIDHGLDVFLARAVWRSKVGDPARRSHLHASARDTAANSLVALDQLGELLADLRTARVAALTYKGPVLAHQAYGDVGARATSDLDVVVAPMHLPIAVQSLTRLGYRPATAFGPRVRRAFARTLGAESWCRRPDELPLDLHTRLCRRALPWDLPEEDRRAATVEVRIGRQAYPALGGGALVLALAMHGARHAFSRLEWLAAIARLAANPADVLDAARLAPRVGATRALAFAMRLVRDVAGVEVASSAVPAMDDPVVERAAVRITATVDGRSAPHSARGPKLRALHLSLLGTRRARFTYRLRSALDPAPVDAVAVPLPDLLVSSYPLVRVARLSIRVLTGSGGVEVTDA